jgi:hypothetical protein
MRRTGRPTLVRISRSPGYGYEPAASSTVVEFVERDLVLEHDDHAARVLRQGPGPVRIALLALHHPALGGLGDLHYDLKCLGERTAFESLDQIHDVAVALALVAPGEALPPRRVVRVALECCRLSPPWSGWQLGVAGKS